MSWRLRWNSCFVCKKVTPHLHLFDRSPDLIQYGAHEFGNAPIGHLFYILPKFQAKYHSLHLNADTFEGGNKAWSVQMKSPVGLCIRALSPPASRGCSDVNDSLLNHSLFSVIKHMEEIKPKYWNDEMIYEPECHGMCCVGVGWEAAAPNPRSWTTCCPLDFPALGCGQVGSRKSREHPASGEMVRTGITLLAYKFCHSGP